MRFKQITYAVEGPVALITLNRPERLNAVTDQMLDELIAAFDVVDADDAVRCVIVTGAGRAFCAGADLAAGGATFDPAAHAAELPDTARERRPDAEQDSRDGGGRLTLRIFDCLKPVIAAINGSAVGVGLTMTLAMDVRLADVGAKLGFVFARRGIVPEACSSYFLPRIVGISQALDWCLTGRLFSAAEGKAAGLLSSVMEGGDVLAAAKQLAATIASQTAPVSVALTRQMLWRGLGMLHPMDAHRLESRAILARGQSGDAAEGIESFLEKRSPDFLDRVSVDMPEFFPWWPPTNYA